MDYLNERKKRPVLTLAVPGGVAGQLFAVGYAAWISTKRQVPVHIQFHHLGSSIGKLGVRAVLESEVAKSLGITFSVTGDNWPPTPLKANDWRSNLTSRIRKKLYGDVIPWETISSDTLLSASRGAIISGYPTDYRIIEESWELLSTMVASSTYADFTNDTGREDTVSIHWRLGDYVKNKYHGAVAWGSLKNCLRYANPENMPVRVFTDSPDLAGRVIREFRGFDEYELVSDDIWSDLFGMTRSRVFIGSHSGVSFLAALALRSNNTNSETWLPNTWFLNRDAQQRFHMGPHTEHGSAFYPARLVISPFPI